MKMTTNEYLVRNTVCTNFCKLNEKWHLGVLWFNFQIAAQCFHETYPS